MKKNYMVSRCKQMTLGMCLCLAVTATYAQWVDQLQLEPVDYVNTLMGTDSDFSLSNGNTYPAVAVPWGMNFWTPQTGAMGNGWAYQYSAHKMKGIKQTHQPSPWMNDYGQFAIMPVTGGLKFKEDDRASWFSHKAETAKPYYYQVYLADHNTNIEVTPTERAHSFASPLLRKTKPMWWSIRSTKDRM